MSSDEEDFVIIQSPSSDIVSLLSLSSLSSRTPTPPLTTIRRTIHDLDDRSLTKILVALAPICQPFVRYDGHHDYGFVVATHVCQRWRALMLACPELWTAHLFTFPNHRAVLAILERTQELPLDINLTFASARMASWYSSLCFKLLPRIRSLKLTLVLGALSRVEFYHLLTSIIAQGAPILENLDVNEFDLRVQERFLDLAFFAPNLRSLRLNGILFPCLSATLSTVHFKITSLRTPNDADDILDVIRSSADTLEHILFDVVSNSQLSSTGRLITDAVSRQEIHIPNAEIVAFRGRDAGLLESLRVPPDTLVCLSLTAALGHVAKAADDIFLSRVHGFLSLRWPCAISVDTVHEPPRLSVHSLPLGDEMCWEQALTLAANSVELAHGLYDCMSYGSNFPTHPVYPGLLIEWHDTNVLNDEEHTGGHQLYTLLDLLQFAAESSEGNLFQAVKCLDICIPDDLPVTEWEYILKGYTAVETLRVHIASTALLATLATRTSTLLPNLTTLVVALDNGMDTSVDYLKGRQARLSVRRLIDLVIAHLEAGRDSSIERVRVEGKPSSMEFAETIREGLSVYVPYIETRLG